MFFFSCLDARKESKENQGVRDASQILGLSEGLNVPGKLPRPRQRFFSCLDARKEPKENQAPCRGRGSLAWYMFGKAYAFASLHILVH